MSGDPEAFRTFDAKVRDGLIGPRVARVKLWDESGRIIYSDFPGLVGHSYPLDEDDLLTLHTGKVDADISDVSAPENRFDPQDQPLLQVYVRVRTPSGQPLLFEVYLRFDTITQSARAIARAMWPAFLVGLVLLELLQLPLAWRLVRRIQRGSANETCCTDGWPRPQTTSDVASRATCMTESCSPWPACPSRWPR